MCAMPTSLLPMVTCAILCGCAGTAPGGRSQVTVPTPIGAIYSSIEKNIQLVGAASSEPCSGSQCRYDKAFDKQVARTGARLSRAAYEIHPQLRERIPEFTFEVADKSEPGCASDASGSIVVYRGVRSTRIDETTLAYLIAREMGYVIARHHDESSATSILATLVAQLLIPVANLAGGAAFLATSAASMVGAKAMTENTASDRSQEADTIALALLNREGWSTTEVSRSLSRYAKGLGDDAWSQELRLAAVNIGNLRAKPSLAVNDIDRHPIRR